MAERIFTANELTVLSDLLGRAFLAARMGQTFDGKRDYNVQFGYPLTLTFSNYFAWYKRGGLAKRIIELPCSETWKSPPQVLDDGNPRSDNAFEAEWKTLDKRLSLFERLYRADVLQSIGKYAVLFLGFRDTVALSDPVEEGQFKRPDDLLYVQPYSEIHAKVSQLDTNPRSERFGLPTMYDMALGASLSEEMIRQTMPMVPVHYSRILHFAEGTLDDEIYGLPSLEVIINLLYDLWKVSGGGAETFWLNASNKMKIETEPGFAIDDADLPALHDKVSDFVHGLASELILQGTKGERLGVQIADPRGNYEILMGQIAGAKGIPLRILIGSERGELASTQDVENMAASTISRQAKFAEPKELRVMIDRFILLGILPPPTNGEYQIEWEHPISLTDNQKADLALKRAQAVSTYMSGSGDMVLTHEELRETMGLDPDMPETEIEPIIDETDPQVDEQFQQGRRAA